MSDTPKGGLTMAAPAKKTPAPATITAPANPVPFAPDDLRQFLLNQAAARSAYQPEPVEFLGQKLFLRPKTGARADERDRWNAQQLAAKGLLDADGLNPQQQIERQRYAESLASCFRAGLIVDCLCDASGKLVFQVADTEKIAQLPPAVLAPVFEAASRVSNLEESPKN